MEIPRGWGGGGNNPGPYQLWVRIGVKDVVFPRGSIYTTIMELGPQNHNGDGLFGANSIIV